MASINTSRRAKTRYRLRLEDVRGGTAHDFALYPDSSQVFATSSAFNLDFEGTVHESREYGLALVASEEVDLVDVALSVNGDEVVLSGVDRVSGARDEGASYRLLPSDAGRPLFAQTYGMAALQVTLTFSDGSTAILATKDIACLCDRADQEQLIARILEEFAFAGNSKAIGWMVAPESDMDDLAVPKSKTVDGASQSLRARLKLCEEILRVYEMHYNYFRLHAHSRTEKRLELVEASSVRTLGRQELTWLSRNTDSLYKAKAPTALKVKESHYAASRIQTERAYRSVDNRENRALLAFADEVLLCVGLAIDQVQEGVDRLRSLVDRLYSLHSEEGLLPVSVVVESCLEKEDALLQWAYGLRRKARRISQGLHAAMPQVTAIRYRLPKRTKVFQEIGPYVELYAAMQRWGEFGNFALLREDLVLRTWRMDKLYEYYVLYRMLDVLAGSDFELDNSKKDAAVQVEYSLCSRFYSNEKTVANLYHLKRGPIRIALYYEPVVYGDAKEEHGVKMHRTACSEAGNDASWVPDYLLHVEDGASSRWIVFDAKFRQPRWMRKGGSESGDGEFMKCAMKYKFSMADASGRPPDAYWLLCGRADKREILPHQDTSWSAESYPLARTDGIATVAPGADALDELFERLGIV